MTQRRRLRLGAIESTSLPAASARARDARRRRPVARDPAAAGLADDLDLGVAPGRADELCTLLRGAVLDHWVREFATANPAGTVVELGPGLDARAGRLGADGPEHWVDVELPEVADLRRELLPATTHLVAGSVLDEDWMELARELPGPYLVVSDQVLPLLPEQGVQRIVFTVARMLPGAILATDVLSRAAAGRLAAGPLSGLGTDWTCEDPRELEPWGLRLLDACEAGAPPAPVAAQLPRATRALAAVLGVAPALRGHRMARFEVLPG
ncbi:class I SAM-dependent methyltransferase [Pseudonocardia parietis]|uniref:O-methyltransferase involved in polyketide biosynthesis n=1 Tax=Pseudonocardia parietis TaxID=570936 RepID=A0ABS4VPQ7_9PSEU|nr:class I SAM-dependent methyltransferase [Pseudonocardia parietis]MBP2365738.1 O-methyltransferase involved in polyketide biosynthesis [Pseudonocardia parietis]